MAGLETMGWHHWVAGLGCRAEAGGTDVTRAEPIGMERRCSKDQVRRSNLGWWTSVTRLPSLSTISLATVLVSVVGPRKQLKVWSGLESL